MFKNKLAYSVALALLSYASHGMAQTAAELQGVKPPQPTATDSAVVPKFQSNAQSSAQAGGATVTLRSVDIEGNKSVPTSVLLNQLGPVTDKALDMAGLTGLVNTVVAYYRSLGYPFAQAYLPPQDLQQGALRIQVLEGTYGNIVAVGKEELLVGAQPFLNYGLSRGDSIFNAQLERTMLIMDDQPGMKIHPMIKPGANQGEADLTVEVERTANVSGEVGFDNTGARSTGENRVHGALFFNSPFRYGDKVSLNVTHTDEDMWLGSVDYEAPIGASGLRGQIGYAHTTYVLGGQFASLNAQGTAKITTAKLTYPLVRSQATNVFLSAGVQHKQLHDEYRSTNLIRNKSANNVPIGLQFDKRDTLLGGGVTYGALTWLTGNIDLDADASVSDASTARTQGSFNKTNLDIARIQKAYGDLSLYGRYSGQWASKNLDASEKFNLGGFYGVRAYPLGEGVGDKGWFTQFELRLAMDAVTPFVFYDYGTSRTNAQPWDTNSGASRTIAGGGVGVRTIYEKWSLDGTISWRSLGGASMADSIDRNPRAFVMLNRRF